EWPAGRVTVNLSPADLPKEGCRYDLPIALGILFASEQLEHPKFARLNCEFYGELGLAGELRPIRGVLLAAAHAAREGNRVIVPGSNLAEARIAASASAVGATTLLEVCALITGGVVPEYAMAALPAALERSSGDEKDLADVRGQAVPKRALLIAAAG